ncbi:Putative DNA-binding domain-containing protein [Parelusimicrobium proximum]|uniref:AlbA family DNA-binding domain-containing protein n=1 Tax=Parelusimicrobium proximum TaxID=3228953 RepID=UPI003D17527B
MFFSKPINDITFDDVVRFCETGVPENKQLDYKFFLPKNNEKFAKTIASFANALGGTIIVGVKDDQNDKPKFPFTGIPYQQKIRNKVEDIIQTYIDPIVFVEINVVQNDRGQMFVVINIPQSNLTPHLVGKMKRAYVRTGQSSRPEVIVHPEKLPWLLNNRKKSERLRHILLDKSSAHFDNHLKNQGKKPEHEKGILSLTLAPLYPEDPFISYKELPAMLPHSLPEGAQVQSVQDGIVIKETEPYQSIKELNTYGFVFFKGIIWQEKEGEKVLSLQTLADALHDFFDSAISFHKRLPFGGPLNFRVSFNNTRGIKAVIGEQSSIVLEDFLRRDTIYNIYEIEQNREDIIYNTLSESAWALGLKVSDETLSELAVQG